MTDGELAVHTTLANEIELSVRRCLDAHGPDSPEHQVARDVLRQAVALRKTLEQWIVRRALRAQQEQRGSLVRP